MNADQIKQRLASWNKLSPGQCRLILRDALAVIEQQEQQIAELKKVDDFAKSVGAVNQIEAMQAYADTKCAELQAKAKAACGGSEPSAGHDYIDELAGLLRVTRGQRDQAEALNLHIEGFINEANESCAVITQLEAQLREREAQAAAMRALTLQIAVLGWANEIPSMSEVQIRKTIVRFSKGQKETIRGVESVSRVQASSTESASGESGPCASGISAPGGKEIQRTTQGEGAQTMPCVSTEPTMEDQARSSETESQKRSAIRGGDGQDKEAENLSDMRSEGDTSRPPRGLQSTVECGVDVLNLSWPEAQNLILSTDAGKQLLERLRKAEALIAVKNDEIVEADQTNRRLCNRLQAVEKENRSLVDRLQEIENEVDEQWLDAIAANWKYLTGKLWETRDGECREEGVQANIASLFQYLEHMANRELLAESLALMDTPEHMQDDDWQKRRDVIAKHLETLQGESKDDKGKAQ